MTRIEEGSVMDRLVKSIVTNGWVYLEQRDFDDLNEGECEAINRSLDAVCTDKL